MNSGPLGQMGNAPLAYVLVQAIFHPILDMQSYIPKIQAELAERYPRYSASTVLGLNEAAQLQHQQNWDFVSLDKKTGVRLSTNQIVIHATHYTCYEDFAHEIQWALSAVTKHVSHAILDRLGMRYVDFILPAKEENPDAFVVEGIRVTPKVDMPGTLSLGVAFMEYQLADGGIQIRYVRGKGQPMLPAELAPLALEPSKIMQANVSPEKETGILDFDRFLLADQPLDVETTMAVLKRMNADLSLAFKTISTPYALEEWK